MSDHEEDLESMDSSSGTNGSDPEIRRDDDHKRSYSGRTRKHWKGARGGRGWRKKKTFGYKYDKKSGYSRKSQKPRTLPSQPHRVQADTIEVTASEISQVLKKFRFKPKRSGEEAVIVDVVKNTLKGESVLAEVFSDEMRPLCYLVAAYIRTRRSRSLVLYISPLLHLIKDESKRWCFPNLLKVAYLDKNSSRKKQVLSQVKNGKVDILLLTPEMLESIAYSSNKLPPIPFACIDQAECILEMQSYRPSFIRLNTLLRVHLKVRCILGLTAAATKLSVNALVKQLELKIPKLEGGLPIAHGEVKLNVLSTSDKEEALLEILLKSSDRSTIINCRSREESFEVTEMLQNRLGSVVLKKRKLPETKVPIAKHYFSNMSQSTVDKLRNDFAHGRVDIVVTNYPYSMSLQQADTVISFTMPETRESLMKGVYQAARSQQQGHVHVLLEDEDECQLPVPDIPPYKTLREQVVKILATKPLRAIQHCVGVSKEHLRFLLGRLESCNHLELLGPTFKPPYYAKIFRKPSGKQLESLCESLHEEVLSVPEGVKELYRDLKSVASRDGDCLATLTSEWFYCPEETSTSVSSPTQEKQRAPLPRSQLTISGMRSKKRRESGVIEKNCSVIAESIVAQQLTTEFATRLIEKEFINRRSDFCVRGDTEFDQVVKMLDAVVSKVKTTKTPQKLLKEFIEILDMYPPLKELASQLTSSYESDGTTAFQTSSGLSDSSSGRANVPLAPATNAQEHTNQPGECEGPSTVASKTSRKNSTGRKKKIDRKKKGTTQKTMQDFWLRNS